MAEGKALTKSEIRAALFELNELCKAEYGIELEQLLIDKTPSKTGPVKLLAEERMQRLTGIVLKQRFATPRPLEGFSLTEARQRWPWKDGSPEESAVGAQRELELLNELRKPGDWNEQKLLSGTSDNKSITWDQFKHDVEHERGLFKVVALYVNDKLRGREGKTLREYFDAEESRRFEAGLDLAVLLTDLAVIGPIAGVLGVPTLVVGVGLVGLQFGYRTLTDPNADRLADSTS
jgi:hypothetical protein